MAITAATYKAAIMISTKEGDLDCGYLSPKTIIFVPEAT
jgi:hypothetical protein